MSGASHATSALIGAATALVVAVMIGGFVRPTPEKILDVERINIREPDGTLRMVVSGAAREPGIIIAGREQAHPNRRSAGILFYNDEGTENGGLIFDGKRTSDGLPHSSGSLTFDRYKQDQVVQLTASEDGGNRTGGLIVNDHPEPSIDFAAVDRARTLPAAEQAAVFRAANVRATRRLFAGRTAEGASEVQLRDASGAARLVLKVDAAGRATIIFLDAKGRARRTIGES